MIKNNIKAILFASLIVALILPFSAMSLADATINDNAKSTTPINADRAAMVELGYELVNSLATPNESRDRMLAQGYELYPGGWLHKDRIKADPVWMEHPNGSGEMILDGDAMRKQYQQRMIEAKDKIKIISHGQTSYEIAVKDDPQNDITYSRAYWNVPNSPSTYDGATNYNFNAIQPLLSSDDTIFQPVLQHGYSSVCDLGNNWATYPFIIILGYVIQSDCISASEGDLIRGIITKDTTYNVWTVTMKNYNNPSATDSVAIGTNAVMTTVFTAVETWNVPNCNELQGDIEYKWISDVGDVDSWDTASKYTPFCGMNTNIVSDSTVQINNNN